MKISYHSWKTYKECPKKFFLEYIKKAPPTSPINECFTLYGKLVEKFFENFCNIWRYQSPYMPPESIEPKLRILYDSILSSSILNWSSPIVKFTQEEVFEMAMKDIGAIMNSENQNYFLNTQSEVTIEITLNDSTILHGRLDFIHRNPISNDICILDGKGTDKIKKNISNNQLLFYALLYTLHHNIMPIELGFFYFKRNLYAPINFSRDILNEFREQLSLDLKVLKSDDVFSATPCPKSCKYCKYSVGCLEHQKDRLTRVRPSKLKNIEGNGVIEFGF